MKSPGGRRRFCLRPALFWRRTVWVVLLAVVMAPAVEAGKGNKDAVESDIEFGIKMAQRGLWKEALFRFQQADLQSPNDGRVISNIAVAYEAVGEYDKALEAYKRALQANSSDRDLKQNYSRFLEFYQAYHPAGEPSEADKAGAAEQAAEPDQPSDESSETQAEDNPAESGAGKSTNSASSVGGQ